MKLGHPYILLHTCTYMSMCVNMYVSGRACTDHFLLHKICLNHDIYTTKFSESGRVLLAVDGDKLESTCYMQMLDFSVIQ